jgi:hypothetical protein
MCAAYLYLWHLLQLFQKCGIAERPRIIRTNQETKQIKVKKEKCKNEKI